MAIIIRGITECPLCGKVLADGDDLVATSHFIHSGPLSRFSDAGMHRSCFVAWPKAGAFRAEFNGTFSDRPLQMLDDGSIVEGVAIGDDVVAKPRLTLGVIGDGPEREELLAALEATERRKGDPD